MLDRHTGRQGPALALRHWAFRQRRPRRPVARHCERRRPAGQEASRCRTGDCRSAEANFPSLLSERSNVEIAFVGRVPVATLAATVTREQVSGPTVADQFYRSGRLWGVRRVRAERAWRSGFAGSHRTVVAVIDTGIAWNHPNLSPNVVFAACDTAAPSCLAYPSLSDHGTHVAGTIAAAFGGGGAVGIGPRLGLASYNIFEDIPDCGLCSYTDSRWAAMIDAAARGFSVINLSLGDTLIRAGNGRPQSRPRSPQKGGSPVT